VQAADARRLLVQGDECWSGIAAHLGGEACDVGAGFGGATRGAHTAADVFLARLADENRAAPRVEKAA
jgi:hypothetical protein